MMEFPFVFVLVIYMARIVYAGNFYKDVDIVWGDGRAKILDNGNLLTLSLDKVSGSAFSSKEKYLFGIFDMHIKLMKNNSAGTVTSYYAFLFADLNGSPEFMAMVKNALSPETKENHDEIDFEFLGNLSGQPYTVHTNIYIDGKGDREQQFHLWFDPTTNFHTYSILWNPKNIIYYIDGLPIRIFQQRKSKGIPFPNNQPMRLWGSLWNGSDWATQGGRVKPDWRFAPFTASYRNFKANACIFSNGVSSCKNKSSMPWFSQELDSKGQGRLKWVQKKNMVYDYCQDAKRFPRGLPRECTIT